MEGEKINNIREAFLDRVNKLRLKPSQFKATTSVSSKSGATAAEAANYKHPEYKGEKLKFSASPADDEDWLEGGGEFHCHPLFLLVSPIKDSNIVQDFR